MNAQTVYCRDTSLRPCPFCGGEGKMAARRTQNGFMGFVQCTYCEAQTRPFTVTNFDPLTFDDPGFDKAAARWQKRDGVTAAGEV